MSTRGNVVEVQLPGLFTTVQDLGRPGFGPIGVSASGAADLIALRLGNLVVGNQEGAAALEMTLLGGTFIFPRGGVFALAGSDFGARLEAAPVPDEGQRAQTDVPLWTTIRAQPGQILRVGPTRSGARSYLCVQGGIIVEDFLGSASTHVLSGLGGFEGRALRKDDVLTIGDAQAATCGSQPLVPKTIDTKALQRLQTRKLFRVTPGPQMSWFSQASREVFLQSRYQVSEDSNRMGIRLQRISPDQNSTAADNPVGTTGMKPTRVMITEGVSLGAIQLPQPEAPIILFVEQQTTGGYPKIANVISADLPSLGQLRPRDEIRFQLVEWDEARQLLVDQEALLRSKNLLVDARNGRATT